MERKPTNSFTAEAPIKGSDSSDKETTTTKKKTLPRVPIQAPVSERPHAHAAGTTELPKKNLFDFAEDAKPAKSEAESQSSPEQAEASTLSPEERQYVAEQIAVDHLESMATQDNETPDVAFLERVQEGVDVETAFTEVAAEMGLSEQEITEALAEMPEEVKFVESEATIVDTHEMTDVEDGEEIDLSSPDRFSSGALASGPTGGGGSRAGGGNSNGSNRSHGRGGSNGPGSSSTANTTYNPIPSSQNQPPARHAETFANRRNRAGELIVVGIVGYLIGRRHGRIKTEKQLIPVQKKLEKQVVSLERNISFKEQQLTAVKERLQQNERPIKGQAESVSKIPTEQRMQPGRKESRIGLEKPAPAEHLAHMIVAAEAPRVVEKRIVERPNNIREAFNAEVVKDMPRAQLLELGEKIIVEGASLRQIYETRLIGEKQLRHLVSEHLQGKDILKALRREIVEREIDFERDPMLRDRVHGESSTESASSGLGELLAKAGVTESQSNQQQTRQAQKETERRAEADRKQHQQRIVTDVAMVTAVVVLAVAVVILAFRG